MKTTPVLLAMLIAGPALAGWTSPSGAPLADTEDMRSAGLFGAQLVLTTQENDVRKNWISTRGTPSIPATNVVNKGQHLRALIVFHGCKANKFGYCNVTAEYSVESPDGTVVPIGTGPVWKGVPSKMGYLQMSQVAADIPFVSKSLPGTYVVRAMVRDTVANAEIPLTYSKLVYKP